MIKIIKKLNERIRELKKSVYSNEEYVQGLEHAVRFIEMELDNRKSMGVKG